MLFLLGQQCCSSKSQHEPYYVFHKKKYIFLNVKQNVKLNMQWNKKYRTGLNLWGINWLWKVGDLCQNSVRHDCELADDSGDRSPPEMLWYLSAPSFEDGDKIRVHSGQVRPHDATDVIFKINFSFAHMKHGNWIKTRSFFWHLYFSTKGQLCDF